MQSFTVDVLAVPGAPHIKEDLKHGGTFLGASGILLMTIIMCSARQESLQTRVMGCEA